MDRSFHFDDMAWKRFLYYWSLVRKIQLLLVASHHKGRMKLGFRFSFLTNCWTTKLPVTWDSLTLMWHHYSNVIMGSMASQITSFTIVYSSVYSGANQRKHQSFASLALVRGIHRLPVNSPHKCPVTQKMLLFNDVIMVATIRRLYEIGLFIFRAWSIG